MIVRLVTLPFRIAIGAIVFAVELAAIPLAAVARLLLGRP